MPAPETSHETRPVLGHVNLMVDSFIANAELDDMRAVIRTLLATSPPSVTATFTNAARRRLEKMNAKSLSPSTRLFVKSLDGLTRPTPELYSTLGRARALYGAGMGFASLSLLTEVVHATVGAVWDEAGEMADVLAAIDADVTQAIQSAKEEMASGRVTDPGAARAVVGALQDALQRSERDTEIWGGDFAFERGAVSVQYWKF
ncbi:uncharacterized protein LAESUDRAFT_739614 [Laetiporus sulphureus 93-53]|uniref:Uncharacterized protein n=1 Tax=Laetiporus sulphureus 93-53 TaxID=1314785 RepID=A0A165B8B3_9APHY|nr:uncharacterized protein LAESUDRAFT_739614 [Laetiporus sulphureus 93-53]KZT00476.1 hypothetical protein LAESUDRAFT_739614 [Laetiporus sulphureus 93-53]